MSNEWKHLLVKPDTHKKVKLQAAAAGMPVNEYVEWLADAVKKMNLEPKKEAENA